MNLREICAEKSVLKAGVDVWRVIVKEKKRHRFVRGEKKWAIRGEKPRAGKGFCAETVTW